VRRVSSAVERSAVAFESGQVVTTYNLIMVGGVDSGDGHGGGGRWKVGGRFGGRW